MLIFLMFLQTDNNYIGIFITGMFATIAAVLGGIIGSLVKGRIDKKLSDENEVRIRKLNQKNKSLSDSTRKLQTKLDESNELIEDIKQRLQEQIIIHSHSQHVLLCGPRLVGKTSLIQKLHSPWKHDRTIPTDIFKWSEVPIINIEKDELIKHPSLSSIRVKKQDSLSLKVYDFPGEIHLQEQIINILTKETTKSAFGVVLVFMFDASEMNNISLDTKKYYNGDLFKQLKMLSSSRISVVRIIIVFNKFDLLKALYPNESDKSLLNKCVNKFSPLLEPIHTAVNSEKVCEVASVLEVTNNEDMGATIIKGEASRAIVKKLDASYLKAVNPYEASNETSRFFKQQ